MNVNILSAPSTLQSVEVNPDMSVGDIFAQAGIPIGDVDVSVSNSEGTKTIDINSTIGELGIQQDDLLEAATRIDGGSVK